MQPTFRRPCRRLPLHAGDLQAELGEPDRADIAGGAGTEDEDVVGHGSDEAEWGLAASLADREAELFLELGSRSREDVIDQGRR